MKTISFVCLLALLSACATPKLEATMDREKMEARAYVLSDNYANHRLQQQAFETSGGSISALDVGDGPVLVLLHGVPTSSWLYRKMIVGLQKDFRVIAIDLLGYGSSDKPASNLTNYSSAAQANYVQEALTQMSVTDYNLVFHDMGGLVAWELVTRDMLEQHSIKSLTILNTIISKQGFDYPKIEKGMMAKALSEAYSNNLSSAAILKMTFKNMGLSSEYKLSEAECLGYVAPMREGADKALYEFFTGFDDARFSRLDQQISGLENYQGKAQVLWGAKDKVLTVEQHPQLLKVLDVDADNISIYPNNSHFLQEEIPAELAAKIRKFLL